MEFTGISQDFRKSPENPVNPCNSGENPVNSHKIPMCICNIGEGGLVTWGVSENGTPVCLGGGRGFF